MPEEDTRALADLDPALPDEPGLDAAQVKKWRREYFTAVHAIDRNVGRIIAALEQQGLWEKTVIIFTSDHGYNIGEHTIRGKGNAMWIAGGVDGPRRPNLWDSSLRVPLLVRWPGMGKPGADIPDGQTYSQAIRSGAKSRGDDADGADGAAANPKGVQAPAFSANNGKGAEGAKAARDFGATKDPNAGRGGPPPTKED